MLTDWSKRMGTGFQKNWSEKADEAIYPVLVRYGVDDEAKVRRAIDDAYPFGERAHWPWHVWQRQVERLIEEAQAYRAYTGGIPLPMNRYKLNLVLMSAFNETMRRNLMRSIREAAVPK